VSTGVNVALPLDDLLLNAIFRKDDLRNVDPVRFKHLAELEIVKYSEHGVKPANGGVALAIGTLSEPSSDKVPISGSNKHQLVLDYMSKRDCRGVILVCKIQNHNAYMPFD